MLARRRVVLALLLIGSTSACGSSEIRAGALPVLQDFYTDFQRGNTERASKHICDRIRDSFLVKSKNLVPKLNPGKIRVNTRSLGSDIGQHYAIMYLETLDSRKTFEIKIDKVGSVWKICPDSADDLVPNDM